MYRQLQEYICDTALKRMHNFYFHGKVDVFFLIIINKPTK
jgi:hypothetical protein